MEAPWVMLRFLLLNSIFMNYVFCSAFHPNGNWLIFLRRMLDSTFFLWIVCRWRKLQPVRNVDKIFVEFFLKITIVSQRTTILAFALASDVCYFCRSFRFLFLTEFSNSLVFSISSLLWTLKRFCNNHCFGMKNSLFVGAISSFPALAGFKCFSLYTSLHWLVIFWHPDLQFW